MATYERLDYGSPDGSQWGSSTDQLGIYGAIPTTQYTSVGSASTYDAYQQSTASASTWGFPTSAAVTSLVRQLSTITVALKRLGIVA